METLSQRPSLARAPGREAAHVVFVLTPFERSLFLPNGIPGRLEGIRQSWIAAEQMPAQPWEELLRDLRPTILVTAWSCSPLPVAWAQSDDCPLEYVCSITGAVRSRIARELIDGGLLVTNWGPLVSHTVAEHALLAVLALLRELPRWRSLMDSSNSMIEKVLSLRSRSLRGRRVGLHGFGAVARELIHMLRPHEVDLAVYSHGVPQTLYDEYGVTRSPSLEALFTRSEVLIECEGLTKTNHGAVSSRILELLPPDAVFVNVGRGDLVDEQAVAEMARRGRIRASLDVYQQEPLPMDSPLRAIDDILLSPHVAGPTSDVYPLLGERAVDNIERYLRGETPERIVTLEIYDRST